MTSSVYLLHAMDLPVCCLLVTSILLKFVRTKCCSIGLLKIEATALSGPLKIFQNLHGSSWLCCRCSRISTETCLETTWRRKKLSWCGTAYWKGMELVDVWPQWSTKHKEDSGCGSHEFRPWYQLLATTSDLNMVVRLVCWLRWAAGASRCFCSSPNI